MAEHRRPVRGPADPHPRPKTRPSAGVHAEDVEEAGRGASADDPFGSARRASVKLEYGWSR